MDVTLEYALQMKRYMDKFCLYELDIAYLAGTNSEVITGIVEAKKGVVLKTLENIANVFSLRYFEFGDPNHELPAFESLPDATKARIALRKKEGAPLEITYKTSDINDRITEVLKSYKVGEEFLAEYIANSIMKNYEETYSVSEIIDRFKKTFKEHIKKTDRKDTSREGRGPKPVFYRLVKEVKS